MSLESYEAEEQIETEEVRLNFETTNTDNENLYQSEIKIDFKESEHKVVQDQLEGSLEMAEQEAKAELVNET